MKFLKWGQKCHDPISLDGVVISSLGQTFDFPPIYREDAVK